jgi:hypothetical protein
MTEPASGPRQKRLDSASIRAPARPLRNRKVGKLCTDGPATTTPVAAGLGTNSYHLRKLAEIGMVKEAAEAGDGRNRWWWAAHEFTRWNSEYRDDSDDRAGPPRTGWSTTTCAATPSAGSPGRTYTTIGPNPGSSCPTSRTISAI